MPVYRRCAGPRAATTPRAVAAGFAGELATAHARHVIAAFLVTGPLVGIWWLLLLDARPWRDGPAALIASITIAALCVAGDLTVLGVLTAHTVTAHAAPGMLAVTAATASLIRVAFAATAIHASRKARTR